MYIPTIVLLIGDCIVGDWECICAQDKHKIRHFRQKLIKSDIFVSYLSQHNQPNNAKKTGKCSSVNISRLSSLTISKYNVAIPRYHHNDHKCFISKTHKTLLVFKCSFDTLGSKSIH